jgi:hypothetical protein
LASYFWLGFIAFSTSAFFSYYLGVVVFNGLASSPRVLLSAFLFFTSSALGTSSFLS